MYGVSVKSRTPTATLEICGEVGNGSATNEERQDIVASELNSESKPTKVGMPWNRRMRPTLVRWCERTEAVRPPPTRLRTELINILPM